MPEGTNLPTEPIPFALASQYTSRVEYELDLPVAAGTIPLDFGTLPVAGAKAIMVLYDTQASAAPVNIAFNSSLTPLELSQGGFMIIASPTPVAGVVSMAVAHTTTGHLRIWILG